MFFKRRGETVLNLCSYLSGALDEKCSTTELLQSFYNRKQVDGEGLRYYSHAFSQTLSSAAK